ncbi:MAG: sigma-70 family RNA polymerase sigma factor [Planctomycetes bacterium]|nr:sigma-70 family RNA polymerase sigma factor [Planctomycetota bacterium]
MSSPPNDLQSLLAHGSFIRALARSLVRGAARADDLVQETWLAALEHPPRTGDAPRSWLAKVLRNFAKRSARAEARRKCREEAAARPEAHPSAEEIVARETTRRRMLEAVLALEEPYRSAVLLRFYEELPPRAIAKKLGVPVETVRTRIKRAIESLRARLDLDWNGDRRAWCVALGRLAFPAGRGAVSAVLAGVIAMKVSTKAVAAAALLLALGFVLWPKGSPPSPPIEPGRTAAVGSGTAPAVLSVVPGEGRRQDSVSKSSTDGERRAVSVEGSFARGVVLDPSGRPIPGARVVSHPETLTRAVRPSDAAPGSEPLSLAESDRDGRFRVALAGKAPRFGLFVEADGFSPTGVDAVRPGDERTVTLDPARTLEGSVKDRAGRPVPGARVRWLGLMGAVRVEREANSGADGGYRLDGIPSRRAAKESPFGHSWWVEVRAEGFAPLMIERPFGTQASDLESPFDLVVVRGATLRGRVLDAETGSPIPGARVFLWSIEGMMGVASGAISIMNPWGQRSLGEATSLEDGSFTFSRIPSRGFHPSASHSTGNRGDLVGYVGAKAPGFAPAAEEVVLVPDGGTWEATVRLWTAAAVRGRVVDASGNPAPGVKVWAYSMERKRAWFPTLFEGVTNPVAETDAEGRYAIGDVQATRAPASVWIKATVRGSEGGAEIEIPLRAGEDVEAPDIRLRTDACADLLVVDSAGGPVWGAQFEGLPLRLTSQSGITDEGGRVRLFFPDWRVRRGPISLVVRARGFGPAATAPFLPAAEQPPEVRVVVGPARRLAGRVVFADGSAARGVQIHVLDPALSPEELTIPMLFRDEQAGMPALRRHGSAASKEDGRFEVGDLPEGPYNVVAFWSDPKEARPVSQPVRATARGVGSDAVNLVLRLPVGPRKEEVRVALEGAVAEAETGVPPLEFRASLSAARRTIWGEKTSPGQFRVEAPPGTWTLRVAAEGFLESERPGIELVSGVPHDPIAVTLDRGARVRGVVRASGQELEDVVVLFRENGRANGPRARLGKDGSYEATGFRPGRYRVELETYRFRGEPYFATSHAHELVVGETERTLVLDLEAVPAGQLWVRVQCGRLAPPEWDNRDTSEEQRQRSEAARLEVRDGQARTLWLWVGLMDGSTYVTNLPAGEYRVHLKIPGAAPVEREVSVEEGKRVDVELEAP